MFQKIFFIIKYEPINQTNAMKLDSGLHESNIIETKPPSLIFILVINDINSFCINTKQVTKGEQLFH